MKQRTIVFLTCCLWWLGYSLLPSLALARHCGGERSCQCGDVVDTNYILPADLGPCAARGLAVASNVTLDCAGHAVRGSGEQSQDFGITLANGVLGSTIKNCEVSGFLRGIRLRAANKNVIAHNTVHHNGNFATHVGYGIDIAGGQENLLQGNFIHHNADEGLHAGTGSHGNIFIENRVEDNVRENFYFLRADRGVLNKNQTRGGGSNSVFVKHSSFLRLEQNVFHDKPVTFRGDAHDNRLVDNIFVKAGLFFQAYEEQGVVSHPTKNEVIGGTMTDATECVKFTSASGNTIRNLSLVHCSLSVVTKAETGGSENTFIDMFLPPTTVRLDPTSILYVGWRVDITVRSEKGAPLVGARVQGFDAQKNLVFDVVTTTDGKIPPQDVIAYVRKGATKTMRTPHLISVSLEQKSLTQEMKVSEPQNLTISLGAAR
jgi:parallel beta-helix repeat protein